MDPKNVSGMKFETIKHRMNDYAHSLTGGYSGSRLEKARYMYANTIRANFIELGEKHQLSEAEFRTLLEGVKGV